MKENYRIAEILIKFLVLILATYWFGYFIGVKGDFNYALFYSFFILLLFFISLILVIVIRNLVDSK